VETILVALGVGAFSGLVGSIAGPFLAHKLDRWHRAELRAEERRRELRQMLEALMRLARCQSSGVSEYQIARTLSRSIDEVRVRQLQYVKEIELRYPFFFWRPHRIKDERLRQLATELQDANTQAGMLMYDLLNGLAGTDWDDQANEARGRIDEALKDVDQRLDELDW